MALFVGEFEQSIDGVKHRLAISSALRDQIDAETDGRNFILVLGPDRHLWLYPEKYYRRLLATMRQSPLPDRHSRKMHLLTAMARVLKTDSQGRLVLPEKSMTRAVISEKVTLVGVFDHIEIWPADEWERHIDEALPTYGEMLYEASDRTGAQGPTDAIKGE
ncbi:MAG: division/cell wall cluster transcriptional repressor MraZ [Planctomycetota bacterium]|jgi:MraZ protein